MIPTALQTETSQAGLLFPSVPPWKKLSGECGIGKHLSNPDCFYHAPPGVITSLLTLSLTHTHSVRDQTS